MYVWKGHIQPVNKRTVVEFSLVPFFWKVSHLEYLHDAQVYNRHSPGKGFVFQSGASRNIFKALTAWVIPYKSY